MNPIIESNKEFAEKLLEKLAPRVTDGTGISGTLNAGDTGALYHIVQDWLVQQEDAELNAICEQRKGQKRVRVKLEDL